MLSLSQSAFLFRLDENISYSSSVVFFFLPHVYHICFLPRIFVVELCATVAFAAVLHSMKLHFSIHIVVCI